MKTTLSILFLLFISIHLNSFAQTWDLEGQNTAGEFIGTLNAQPFIIRTTDLPRLTVTAGGNLGINTSTPAYLLDVSGGDINLSTGRFIRIGGTAAVFTDINRNAALGIQSDLPSMTGANDNTFVGFDAGKSVTGGDGNTFVGSKTGDALTSGNYNLTVGFEAGTALTTGSNSVFIGAEAGKTSTTSSGNVYVGAKAGATGTTASENVYIGFEAATLATSNDNTVIGYRAAKILTSGGSNVVLGKEAAAATTTGGLNTFLGRNSGDDNTTGSRNTYVGANTRGSATLTNATAIGANAKVEADNSLVLGSVNTVNGATANTNVGIGITSPAQSLHVQGTVRITGSVGTATTVMGRDASGDVSAITIGSGLTMSGNTLTATGGGGGDDWHITGNTGTIAVTNFIGTTDSEDFVVKTNGTEYLRVIGETTNLGNVGIHTATPTAVLHVVDNASASSNTAIHGYVTNGTISKAVHGYSLLNSGTAGYGGYFSADAGSSGPTTNYGVWTIASGAADNYGIYATYTGSQSTTDCAGYFAGNAYASGMFIDSDSKLKENITDMSGALRVVAALRPVSFEHRTEEFPLMNLQQGLSYGFIAQEVEPLVPGLVTGFKQPGGVDADGVEHPSVDFKALNYIGIIPFLTKAIQEQQAIIEAQEARLLTMETERAAIKQRLGY